MDIFTNSGVEAPVGRGNRGSMPYNLRPASRSYERQSSVSEWLISSQQSQPEPVPSRSASTQSDLDLASQASVFNLGENVDSTAITSILLLIRRDVKQMNKRFGHREISEVTETGR